VRRKNISFTWRRAATFAMPAAFAWMLQSGALAQNAPAGAQAPGCTVSGTVMASHVPLPGVVLSLGVAGAQTADVSSSAPDGSYMIRVPGPGNYKLTAELLAFAPFSTDVPIADANCHARVDIEMMLASRAPAPAPAAAATPAALTAPAAAPATPAGTQATAAPGGGRGQNRGQGQPANRANGGRGGQQFQSLALVADQAGLARPDDSGNAADEAVAQALLPPGFSPQTSSESVTSLGATQGSESFFGNPGDRLDAMREAFGAGGDSQGIPGQPGAAAGPGGGAGGRGGPGGGRGGDGGGFGGFGGPGGFAGRGGRGGANQVRGSVFQSFDTSALDAGPVALNGSQSVKPQYLQQRFGATLGGPLAIPHVFNAGTRTFFFLNYTGNHSSSPYDQYSTVPTDAERGGDLTGLGQTAINPITHLPFAGNQIPANMIDPAAAKLLNLIPGANQPGTTRNFHTVGTTSQDLDDINLRFIHNFGAQPQRGRGGAQGAARGGGGGGGRGGGRGGGSNLNLTIHYRHSDNTALNPFPTLGGSSKSNAWDIPVSYTFTKGGIFSTLRFGFNRQHAETSNLFAGVTNVAGDAGLQGVSPDPFDWGAPQLSIGGPLNLSLRDTTPSVRTDETISFGDTMTKTRGKQTLRFGGDFRSIRADSQSDPNPRGSFVFTGLFSGSQFGDFLLGLPQQATAQFGPGLEQFRETSWDLFIQDDWRASSKVTINAGLRYEYYSPYSEASNRLATLDAAPDFSAAVPTLAGQAGPYSGALPDTIVRPFRLGFAPRLALAWKPKPTTTVRTGYSINYSNSTYASIASQLAAQPPFAASQQVLTTLAAPVPLETVLKTVVPGATNSFAVDPNYRLGYVQIWNLDVQRDFIRTISTGITYVGTHGADLDLLRAPNRGPLGLRIAGIQPFIWESSGADSIMHSVSFRIRRRLTRGVAAGATYTLSKSIDDASSIGGGSGVVAQNDLDLAAERGLSSFDQRHRLNGDFTLELPFGANRRWLNNGVGAALLGNWVLNGSVQLASGTPFTARVLASVTDVARGTNGTLRANYNGQPIQISDPTSLQFFNTGAFSAPLPGTFGNAGRNTIIGPGTSNVNMSLTRNLSFGQNNRGMSIQLTANNVFNTVQYSTIDTIVGSNTFGEVTGARATRRVQVVTRFRF
jgi:hypothetical protein